MDPKHSRDVLRHLEKQKELIMDAYRSMSHELHRLQVEEEMMMHKHYELMSAQGLIEKKKSGTCTDLTILTRDGEAGALVNVSREEP